MPSPIGSVRRSLYTFSFVVLASLAMAAALTGGASRASYARNAHQTVPTPTSPWETPTGAASEFGLVFVNSAERPSTARRIRRGVDTGAGMDRMPLYWDLIETASGQYDWSAQDAALQANEAQGLDTLAVLLGTPGHYRARRRATAARTPPLGGSFVRYAGRIQAQATCNPEDGPPAPSGLWNPIFSDGSDEPAPDKTIHADNPWARFVHAAVARYMPGGPAGTHIRHWEIWNEPDLCPFWSGTPGEYARLLKVAYLVIKQADPEATVVWGGLAHFANPQWLDEMLEALLRDPAAGAYGGFFDAAGSHQYSLSYLGYQYTQRIREALAARGYADKPIWITESGVPVCDDYPGPRCPSPWRASPAEQAAYIWQNMAYTRLAGGGPIFHFMLYDDCGNIVAVNSPDGFGLFQNESDSFCSPAHGEPRLAYRAFVLANRYFPGTELVWADLEEGKVRRVAFYHPETNERRLLTWSVVTETVTGSIPAVGASARLIHLDGRETPLTPVEGVYRISLPGATNRNWPDERGGYRAGIYGEPILLVEKDELPPRASMDSLPPYSPPTFAVNWSVQDWGSGVVTASLWVQVDGGPWQAWKEGVDVQGSADFSGEAGRRYGFTVRAEDRAGHRLESSVPLAETKTVTTSHVRGRVIDPAGQAVPGAEVRIGDVTAVSDDEGAFGLTVPLGAWDIGVNGELIHRNRFFAGEDQLLLLYAPNGNAVVNGNFERGLEGWQPSGSSSLAVEKQPGTEDHALRLATAFVPNPGVPGEEGSEGGNSTLSQRIQVPGKRPYLAFAYRVESSETEPGHDRFEVMVAPDGRPADYLLVQERGSDWQYRFMDLSPYAGQSITLIFNVYETSPQRRTRALVDVVTVSDVSAVREPAPPQPNGFLYLPTVMR